jgi:hypothetical protein
VCCSASASQAAVLLGLRLPQQRALEGVRAPDDVGVLVQHLLGRDGRGAHRGAQHRELGEPALCLLHSRRGARVPGGRVRERLPRLVHLGIGGGVRGVDGGAVPEPVARDEQHRGLALRPEGVRAHSELLPDLEQPVPGAEVLGDPGLVRDPQDPEDQRQQRRYEPDGDELGGEVPVARVQPLGPRGVAFGAGHVNVSLMVPDDADEGDTENRREAPLWTPRTPRCTPAAANGRQGVRRTRRAGGTGLDVCLRGVGSVGSIFSRLTRRGPVAARGIPRSAFRFVLGADTRPLGRPCSRR